MSAKVTGTDPESMTERETSTTKERSILGTATVRVPATECQKKGFLPSPSIRTLSTIS